MTATQRRNISTFYFIILTQTLSIIGTSISGIAIGIYIFNQTGEATPLALVSFFSVIPPVLASSVAGVLADRWNRRKIIMLSDTGQAVGTVLLLISFLSGGFQVWHLYVITLLQAICRTFQDPAFSASVTMLIPDDQRERANAVSQMAGPLAGIIAPVLTGLIFAIGGVTGAILVDLLTFVIAVGAIYLIHIPQPEATEEGKKAQGSMLREMLGGLRFLTERRVLFFTMLQISLVNFLFSSAMIISTPYLLSRTGSEATLGVLLSVMNIGALAGGIIIGAWGGTRPRIHTIMPGIIIAGVFLALTGVFQQSVWLGVALFLMMLPLPMVNASFFSMMQTKVPPDMQGRVFAVLMQVSMLLTPLAALMIGPLTDQVVETAVGQPGWEVVAPLVGNTPGSGMGLIYLVFGSLVALTSLAMYLIPSVRKMEVLLPDYTPQVEAQPVTQEVNAPATA